MLHDFTTLKARYAAANAAMKQHRKEGLRTNTNRREPPEAPTQQGAQSKTRSATGPTSELTSKVASILSDANQD